MIHIMDHPNTLMFNQTMASVRQNYERLCSFYQDEVVSAHCLQETR